jgi:hypothetical protein
VVGDQMEQQELLNRIRHAISVYHFHNPQESFLVQVRPSATLSVPMIGPSTYSHKGPAMQLQVSVQLRRHQV